MDIDVTESQDTLTLGGAIESEEESVAGAFVEPVLLAIRQWHQQLTMEQTMQLVTGLRAASSRVIRLGTGFSGCEVTWKTIEALNAFWEEHFGIKLQM